MKVPKPSQILHSLVNKGPLPQLTAEETERSLKYAEEIENTATPEISSEPETLCQEPHVGPLDLLPKSLHFKTPLGTCFPGTAITCSDILRNNNSWQEVVPKAVPTLINLSFSQPNSPRTPCVRTAALDPRVRLPTPASVLTSFSHKRVGESVLNTPCVAGALQELQRAQDTDLPDLLSLIEDDKTGLSQVERQLLRNTEVELTDHNVVDYLLQVALEDTGSSGFPRAQFHSPQPQLPARSLHVQKVRPAMETQSGLNVRRKRRSQKRMTTEEVQVIRRQRATRAARAQHAQEESREPPQLPAPVASCSRVVSGPPQLPASVACGDVVSESVSPRQPSSPSVIRRSKRRRRQVSRFEVHW